MSDARENESDQVLIGVNLASDWLKECCGFYWTNQRAKKSKPESLKSQITFDTQLKMSLCSLVILPSHPPHSHNFFIPEVFLLLCVLFDRDLMRKMVKQMRPGQE